MKLLKNTEKSALLLFDIRAGSETSIKRDKNPRPKLFFKILFNNKREQKVSHDDMIAIAAAALHQKKAVFFARAQTA